MIQIKREILEQLIAMSKNVASKEEIRYFLTAVCLDSPDTTRSLRLRACDGHRLFEATHNMDSLPELLERKECLVYPEAVKSIELMLKTNKRQETFYACVDATKLKLSALPNGDLITMGEIKPCGEYPNSDAIKPKTDGYTLEVAFNPEYLLKLYNASRDPSNSATVKLTFKATQVNETWQLDKLAPIMVDVPNTDNEYALLMPKRF